LLSHYRGLIHARNDNIALRSGEIIRIDSGSGNVLAFLRHTEEQSVLVIINMRNREVDNYGLTLDASPLTALTALDVIYSNGAFSGEGEFALPELNADGGFSEYMPFVELPGNSTLIFELN